MKNNVDWMGVVTFKVENTEWAGGLYIYFLSLQYSSLLAGLGLYQIRNELKMSG